jgi:hypothetical protein
MEAIIHDSQLPLSTRKISHREPPHCINVNVIGN